MAKIFITHKIPEVGVKMLKDKGHIVELRDKSELLPKSELLKILGAGNYDGVLCLLTDQIDADVFVISPLTKIFANYAVGFDNIALAEAKKREMKTYNLWGDVADDKLANHRFAGPSLFKRGFGGEQVAYLHARDLPLSWKYWVNWGIENVRKKIRSL